MPTAEIITDQIHITDCFRIKDLVKSIPGARWTPKVKAWTFPATPSCANEIHMALTPHRLQASEDFLRLANDWHAQQATPEGIRFQTATPMWDHQRKAMNFIWNKPAALLYMGMGTGKSKVVVDYALNKDMHRVLILCPLSVITAWEKQFSLHAPFGFKVLLLNKGATAKRAQQLERHLDSEHPTVTVLNYESAWRPAMAKELMKHSWDLLVLDESHKIKAPGGKASKFCQRLGANSMRRLALTGTPMPHSPMDLYGQFRALDPGIFGTSFVAFRSRYAIMGGFDGKEIIQYQNEEMMNQRLYSITYRADRDVLDLPEAMTIERTFTMDEKSKKVYRELEQEFITDLDSGIITATNALTRLLRLQQITSGFVRDDEGVDKPLNKGKVGLLSEVIEQAAGEPLVVFCRFKHDLAAVHEAAKAHKATSLELSGSRRELERWQADEAQILAVQIQSGGVGVDLTRARYCAFYSIGFSLGEYEQALARVHRPGQTRPVTFIHLVCENSVDRRVQQALDNKRDIVKSVLDMYKKE